MIKNVLITGVRGGIGKSIVREFMNEEYKIFAITSSDNEKEFKNQKNYMQYSLNFEDINYHDQITKIIENIEKIDILINNAGAVQNFKNFLNLNETEIKSGLNINFFGAMWLCQKILPYMIKNNFGRIINISSNTVALKGSINNFDYYLSKGMIDLITKYIAKHYSEYNITCNAISPGLIDSGMSEKINGYSKDAFLARQKLVPGGVAGKVEDISSMVKYLSLDSSNFITGQIIQISKGE